MSDLTFKSVSTANLRDLNLEIKEMYFSALVGTGAEELIQALVGTQKVASGEILIKLRKGDRPINNLTHKNPDIAYIPPGPNYGLTDGSMFFKQTVYDNLTSELKRRKFSRQTIDERVQGVTQSKLFKITELLEKRPSELSIQQRFLVALCKAIVNEPYVYVISLPELYLANEIQWLIDLLMQSYIRLQSTFIVSTESVELAFQLSNEVIIMQNNKILQIGSPASLYAYPEAKHVLDSRYSTYRMNYFEGRVSKDAIVLQGGTSLPIPNDRKHLLKSDVTVGILPEHIYHPDYLPSGIIPASISNFTVQTIEYFGGWQAVHLNQGLVCLTSTGIDPRVNLQEGQEIPLVVDLNKVHFFDRKGLVIRDNPPIGTYAPKVLK